MNRLEQRENDKTMWPTCLPFFSSARAKVDGIMEKLGMEIQANPAACIESNMLQWLDLKDGCVCVWLWAQVMKWLNAHWWWQWPCNCVTFCCSTLRNSHHTTTIIHLLILFANYMHAWKGKRAMGPKTYEKILSNRKSQHNTVCGCRNVSLAICEWWYWGPGVRKICTPVSATN